MMFTALPYGTAQQPVDVLLSDIAADTAYKNKTMVLRLKLKNSDMIFKKITFYDRKNHDIIFDISGKMKGPAFQKRMLDLHEGMEYLVTFTVTDVSPAGYVMGDLSDFVPVVLTRIPESGK